MPARAPTPGAGRRLALSQELKQAEDDWIRIVVGRDEADLVLWTSSIGPNDERACQSQTGLNLWDALASPSEVRSVSVLYWIARRKNGEKELPFHKCAFTDIADVIAADVELWFSDPEGDEEVDLPDADPTQSGGPSGTTGPPSPTSTDSTPETSAENPS